MTLVPKVIHFIYPVWENTRPLSYVNYVAVALARKHHPDYTIKFWVSGTPVQNENWDKIQQLVEIHPFESPTHWKGIKIQWPQYSSDIARLQILDHEGGIYMDTDMLCLKPLDNLIGNKLIMSWEDQSMKSISNAMILSPPNNNFLKIWLGGIGDAMKGVWAEGGVVLPATIWDNGTDYLRQDSDIILPKNFCPLDLSRKWLFDPYYANTAEALSKDSYAIHVFETYWRDIIKDITPEWCNAIDCLFSRISKSL